VLGENVEHPPETGAAAVFKRILDEGVAAGNRGLADDRRRQIVLGVGIAIENVALAALLI
jgi:hypothetical protein